MQVSVENTGGLERKLTVQLPGEEIDNKVNSKLRELSKTVRIKGFRPGRVPLSVVRQRYGKQARQEIVGESIQSSLQQAIATGTVDFDIIESRGPVIDPPIRSQAHVDALRPLDPTDALPFVGEVLGRLLAAVAEAEQAELKTLDPGGYPMFGGLLPAW